MDGACEILPHRFWAGGVVGLAIFESRDWGWWNARCAKCLAIVARDAGCTIAMGISISKWQRKLSVDVVLLAVFISLW